MSMHILITYQVISLSLFFLLFVKFKAWVFYENGGARH